MLKGFVQGIVGVLQSKQPMDLLGWINSMFRFTPFHAQLTTTPEFFFFDYLLSVANLLFKGMMTGRPTDRQTNQPTTDQRIAGHEG